MWRWILVGAGMVVITGGAVWMFMAPAAQDDAKPRFGLADLVANPYDDDGQILTPLEEARQAFRDRFKTDPKRRERPDISGTSLMLRAILELDPAQRQTAINDVVRHLRRFPEVKDDVYALVETFRSNNPHLSDRIAAVTQTVDQRLAVPPKRLLEWLDF